MKIKSTEIHNKPQNKFLSSLVLGSLSFMFLLSTVFLAPVKADIPGIGVSIPLSSKMELSVGKSTIIKLKGKIERISLSNPGIAYIKLLTPNQIMLIGRNPGRTNLYVWFPPIENSKPGTPSEIIGTEVSVGLPPPPFITSTPTMEIVNGEYSELIYLGNPAERINNASVGRTSGPATDMPESCLSPGCI